MNNADDFLFRLIRDNGFSKFQQGLGSRFQANKLKYEFKYSITDEMSTIFMRLESSDRIGEVCFWESGLCDVSFGDNSDGEIKHLHFRLGSGSEFHDKISRVFLFVTHKENEISA